MAIHLPLLEPHRRAHTYCTYCPKLCRFSCPVSTVQASETTTPWAKMVSLHHSAEGRLALDEDTASTWYACTGCMRCRSHCTHGNEVGDALRAGRAHAVQAGVAPKTATQIIADQDRRESRAIEAARRLFGDQTALHAKTKYFPGCTNCILRPSDATDALHTLRTVAEERIGIEASGCCGLPRLDAGDREGFIRSARAFFERVRDTDRVVMSDPGCLHALKVTAPRLGVSPTTELLHTSEWLLTHLARLAPQRDVRPVRYHDACKLGRGLGVYDPPRAILEHITGQPVHEFHRNRDNAECTGGGGQLPRTDRQSADAIAKERLRDHGVLGGGSIVTTCPASAHRLGQAATDGTNVLSFDSVVREALGS